MARQLLLQPSRISAFIDAEAKEDSVGQGVREAGGGGNTDSTRPRLRLAEPKFRCNAKKFSLTYPQSGEGIPTKEGLFEFLTNTGARYVLVARELHEDGGVHYHAVVEFAVKRNITRAGFFDYGGHHCNVQGTKDAVAWRRYCKKGGDWIETKETFDIDDYEVGKRHKAYADFQFSVQYKRRERRRDCEFPLSIKFRNPEGLTLEYQLAAPVATAKRRHLWIQSEPNAGKSYWIERMLANQKFYYRRKGKYPFEFYGGERLVVYDDIVPKFEEIADVCNTYSSDKHVYGDTRYFPVMWGESCRTLIVLNNHLPSKYYIASLPAVEARFHVITVKEML